MNRYISSLAIILFIITELYTCDEVYVDYSNHCLIRVMINRQLIQEIKLNDNLDVWSIKPFRDLNNDNILLVDIFLTINNFVELKNYYQWELNKDIIKYVNIKDYLDYESKLNENCPTFYSCYKPYDEIIQYCDDLMNEFPQLVSKFQIGETYEGREIYSYLISTQDKVPGENREPREPTLYLEALQHAREWIATPSLIFGIESLLRGYANNNLTIVHLIDNFDWVYTPVVNIDGYNYTWTTDRFWRKNRHEFSGGIYGVDLNRNWGPNDTWCTTGSSTNKRSDTYCGEHAFSEPESRSIAEYLDEKRGIIKAGVDYHSYSDLILWPWQYTYNKTNTADYNYFTQVGLKMEEAINTRFNKKFISEQGSDLYEHSGGFIDYNYDKNRMASFTYELRGDKFNPPESEIIFSGAESFQGIVTLAEYIIENGPLPN